MTWNKTREAIRELLTRLEIRDAYIACLTSVRTRVRYEECVSIEAYSVRS